MKIAFFEIQNFRKLVSCRIELSSSETLFVGANNSGKTSAMDALIMFLKNDRRRDFSTTDFTLSNWNSINDIGKQWVECKDESQLNLELDQFIPFIPSLDIWLEVDNTEIHYVSDLIPTLSWKGGSLGVRLSFEPKNIEDLYKDFVQVYKDARKATTDHNKTGKLALWPESLKEFLDKRIGQYFKICAYLLDPAKLSQPEDGIAIPQILDNNFLRLDFEPFNGLFKIDIINAQRGFTDAKTSETLNSGEGVGGLTTQLRGYFDKHLNPTDNPDEKDLDALLAIDNARSEFDVKLKESFSNAISELEELGYPGFADPKIKLTSKVNPLDGLNHNSAVQFEVSKNGDTTLSLPEKYNGLGYQNLVSMVFKIISFRDDWMRVGKAGKGIDSENQIEPLHIVLIEEPEAHLHAQVQQVFIKKAFSVLRNHANLKGSPKLSTQMIVSTHSSHIAHEVDFGSLRYFKRSPSKDYMNVPSATVINLSETFGQEANTSKFATRYLKSTHCDLFFADAVILVEGQAERMLLPHFIRNNFSLLDSRFISILEIGGSHAHKLQPLIDKLGIITLVVTDLDSVYEKKDINNKKSYSKCLPQKGQNQLTSNSTLKEWLPKKETLDDLIDLGSTSKLSTNELIRIGYQYPFKIDFSEDEKEMEVIPYTFEDALVLSNIELFKEMSESTGLLQKMYKAVSKKKLNDAHNEMFNSLNNGKKAEMALELLYQDDPKKLKPPQYVAEGLAWLQLKLSNKDLDFIDDKQKKEVKVESSN